MYQILKIHLEIISEAIYIAKLNQMELLRKWLPLCEVITTDDDDDDDGKLLKVIY